MTKYYDAEYSNYVARDNNVRLVGCPRRVVQNVVLCAREFAGAQGTSPHNTNNDGGNTIIVIYYLLSSLSDRVEKTIVSGT